MLRGPMGVRRFLNLQTATNGGIAPATRAKPAKPILRLPADTRMIDVHGESFYGPALRKFVTANGVNLNRTDDFDLDDVLVRLIPEPTNPQDPRAIMVAAPDGSCLGHVGRANALKYAEIITELAETHDLWCKAQIGGGKYPSGWRIGVWLYIPTPGELAKQAGDAAAQSVVTLERKWREATALQHDAFETFTATLARIHDHDEAHMQFVRAGLEKAIRSHTRSAKALQRAALDFHGTAHPDHGDAGE